MSGTFNWHEARETVQFATMGRAKRAATGGIIFHVLNRANARQRNFDHNDDYAAFERVLEQAVDRFDTRLLAYCLMPNHWHMVVWPRKDDELSRFVGWLTLTHTQRRHANRQSAGTGHLYQGRFKSFPVQDDEPFLTGEPKRSKRCQEPLIDMRPAKRYSSPPWDEPNEQPRAELSSMC